MHFFIQKLKICNFLSFFGEYEINLKPLSGVICNYYEGKDDFLRSLEFVFGAKLSDIRIDDPMHLVHKVLREEFLINHEIQCYVEVTINLVQEKRQLKFLRGIKYGSTSARIEHKISDAITTKLFYEEKLSAFGLMIRQTNLIFYKEYFNEVIWGTSEDLERTIVTCIREKYLAEKWKQARKEVKFLTQLKNRTAEKNYNAMKKNHYAIAKFTDRYENMFSSQENIKKKILKDFMDSSSEDSSLSSVSVLESKEEDEIETSAKKKEKLIQIDNLDVKIEYLTKKLHSLKLKEAVLTSELYYEEIKLSAKTINQGILLNRISEIKNEVREKEKELSRIYEEGMKRKSELENLSIKISFDLVSLGEIQRTIFLQNRFTSYGRFYDFLQPSHYINLLKDIIGPEIFYAHLCDSLETAFNNLELLKVFKYEHREVFISFDLYSHKLKDILIASGEKGIQINTLEQLLIFLCKLKHYGLIKEVPVIVEKNFDYEYVPAGEYVYYSKNGLQFTKDGLICYKSDDDTFCTETYRALQKNLIYLQTEEELKYMELKNLHFKKWQTLFNMTHLENDIFYLQMKWKKSTQKPVIIPKPPQITEIYEEYSEIFSQYFAECQTHEEEFQESEESLFIDDSQVPIKYSKSSSDESLSSIVSGIEEILAQRTEIMQELEAFIKDQILLLVGPFYDFKLRKNFPTFNFNVDKTRFFFEKELRKLKKLMTEDDFDHLVESQEWRKILITNLIKDFNDIKNKLKNSNEALQIIASERNSKLHPLTEHLSHYLSSTFSHLLDESLSFIDLNLSSGEETLQLMSCMGDDRINLVDVKHFNTFLRFISTLSVFMELAVYKQIPLVIFDSIEEFFPLHNDDLDAVLDSNVLEKIIPDNKNPRFHLLMRVGQFLEHYIKKNTPSTHIRNNGTNREYINGPMQIIYFAEEDLIHAAEHYIWIHNQILPKEYISEDCDSYSEIHEIKLNTINQ